VTERIIGTVAAGSSPVWEVVEDEDRPSVIWIRSVEDHSDQIQILRSAAPTLSSILGHVDPVPPLECN